MGGAIPNLLLLPTGFIYYTCHLIDSCYWLELLYPMYCISLMQTSPYYWFVTFDLGISKSGRMVLCEWR